MFQTFDVPSFRSEVAPRLARLRTLLREYNFDAFLVPRADEYQGEYVPPAAERLRWLTGFSGSAGFAVAARGAAALFVDGRYTVQAKNETDTTLFEILELPQACLSEWLGKKLPQGAVIGFDPKLHAASAIERLKEVLTPHGIVLKAAARNPVDLAWGPERPAPPAAPVMPHPLEYSGKAATEKIASVQRALRDKKEAAALLTLPESVSWLLNIRGADVPHNPAVLAFALVPASGKVELFIDPRKITPEAAAHLAPAAIIKPPAALSRRLKELRASGQRVRADPDTAAFWFLRALGRKSISRSPDPCLALKAVKNAAEIAGARAAHLRDGAALTRFLAWFDQTAPEGRLDEITAARQLESFRRATNQLKDISFDTIAASGPNGAIVHYRVTEASNRRIRPGDIFLIDSGGQYLDGTTDITRTIAVGDVPTEARERFTLVLKGHIAIATARFPKGTRGADLDPFARRALWNHGLDYAHGTGHGVGSFLSVHEGPPSLSKRGAANLEPGMICSNEPGYYKEGAYGIRIENLVLVRGPEKVPGGDKEVLSFETLSLAPFDRRLILKGLLTPEEIAWVDSYHARVRECLTPEVDAATRRWLEAATAPL